MYTGATVVILSCGSGGFYNSGHKLLKAVAKKFNRVTYGPQSGCFTTPNNNIFGSKKPFYAEDYYTGIQKAALGKWTEANPNGKIYSLEGDIYLDAYGRVSW
jgi:hypothetical protein